MSDFWKKQGSEPLFPDLLWSRPENRQARGKLLIIGGQAQEFSHVAAAYSTAEQAGAGTVRVILPQSTEKVTKGLPNIEYAPSNPSGSFSRQALAEFFDASTWADHVLLAGDLGKNSETTTILDGYLLKCPTSVTISQNALGSISLPPEQLLSRPVTMVLDGRGLQKLATDLGLTKPVLSTTTVSALAEILHEVTKDKPGSIVAEHENTWWVSAGGRVTSTAADRSDPITTATHAAVWTMQNPSKIFEALTVAVNQASN